MPRDFRLYLNDILEAIHQIRTYMADQDEEAFTDVSRAATGLQCGRHAGGAATEILRRLNVMV